MTSLGERIRTARIAAGFDTAIEGAARLGVESARYRHWEGGRREPPIDLLPAIAKAFKVDLEWLVTGKGDTSAEKQEILSIYDAMDEPSRSTFRKMIRGLRPESEENDSAKANKKT
jgi:transcriptional regulator with XRE-family HTH domain